MKIIFHLQFVSELLQCTLFSRSDQTNKQTKKCVFSDSVVPFFLNISLYQSYCVCFYFTDFLIVMSWNLGLSIQHQYYYQVLKKVDETTVQSRALTRVTIQKIKFFCGCYYSRHVTALTETCSYSQIQKFWILKSRLVTWVIACKPQILAVLLEFYSKTL